MRYLCFGSVVAILASAVAGCDSSGSRGGGDKPVAAQLPESEIAQMKNKFLPQKQSKGGSMQDKKPLSKPNR